MYTQKIDLFLSKRLTLQVSFENILTVECGRPLGQTSEKGYLGLITLKMGKLSVFISYLLEGCLRVIHNSNIFENLDPAPGF